MSIIIINKILDSRTKDMTSSEKFLLVAIARKADNVTFDGMFPSINLLAKETNISSRHVIRLIESLIKKGYLIKLLKGSNVTHRANEYSINLDKLDQERLKAKLLTNNRVLT